MSATEQELRYAAALRLNPQVRAATIILAASNARQQWAAAADIVCSGVNDEEAILTAINALPSAGGKILFSEGLFTLSVNISSARDGVLLRGMGPGTVISGGTVTLSGTNSGKSELTVGTYQSSGGGTFDATTIASDVKPSVDDIYSLGSASKEFKDLYLSGQIYVDGSPFSGSGAHVIGPYTINYNDAAIDTDGVALGSLLPAGTFVLSIWAEVTTQWAANSGAIGLLLGLVNGDPAFGDTAELRRLGGLDAGITVEDGVFATRSPIGTGDIVTAVRGIPKEARVIGAGVKLFVNILDSDTLTAGVAKVYSLIV